MELGVAAVTPLADKIDRVRNSVTGTLHSPIGSHATDRLALDLGLY
jgi:hypothetical protein